MSDFASDTGSDTGSGGRDSGAPREIRHEGMSRRSAIEAATTTAPAASERERELLAALRRGDEQAFTTLVERHTPSLLRLAMLYVSSRAVAEEVVQETWLGVLQGLDRFEGRSALKTWIFRILVNTSKTRAQRERRTVPFSSLTALDADGDEPGVDPDRFLPPDDPHWPGAWAAAPESWAGQPEERLLSGEARERIQTAIATLAPAQREVITLRDLEGWSSDEVCNLLSISETNQRVLLHRARSRVRRALEQYLAEK